MKDVEGIESEQVMVLERLKQNQRQDYLKVKKKILRKKSGLVCKIFDWKSSNSVYKKYKH